MKLLTTKKATPTQAKRFISDLAAGVHLEEIEKHLLLNREYGPKRPKSVNTSIDWLCLAVSKNELADFRYRHVLVLSEVGYATDGKRIHTCDTPHMGDGWYDAKTRKFIDSNEYPKEKQESMVNYITGVLRDTGAPLTFQAIHHIERENKEPLRLARFEDSRVACPEHQWLDVNERTWTQGLKVLNYCSTPGIYGVNHWGKFAILPMPFVE